MDHPAQGAGALPPSQDPPVPAWAVALAQTALAPNMTITRAIMSSADGEVAATIHQKPRLQFETTSLPAVSVRFEEARGPGADESDLVVSDLIAEGGMGRVFRAQQRSLAREVAIKTPRDPGDAAQRDALLWEGQIAGHLDHPGVTPVHLLGTTADGRTVLVMKRIIGVRWTDLIEGGDEIWSRFSSLSSHRLRAHVEILMEVARTVHFAHTRGIVHLDIKPDNVMIGELGEVCVVDWGIATPIDQCDTRTGFIGTPIFAAPELVTGAPIGTFTDVYLLGATLHFVLTGAARHEGTSLLEVLASATANESKSYGQEVPRELGELANRATSTQPNDRPRDALEFRKALGVHLEHTTSLSLTKDGERILERLELERDAARAHRLATEARFAFRGAIDRWRDNPYAHEGLARCLEIAVGLEIDRENAPAAAELAAEMGGVPADLRERLDALRERLQQRAKSEAELQRMKAEGDLALGAGDRTKLLVLLLLASGVGIGALTLLSSGDSGDAATTRLIGVGLPIGGLLVLGVLVFRLRRGLLANLIGRRIIAMLFVLICALAVQRTFTVLFPLDAIGTSVRSELVMLSMLGLTGGVFVSRWAFFLAVAPLVGALATTAWASKADLIFNVCGFASIVGTLAAVVISRHMASSTRA